MKRGIDDSNDCDTMSTVVQIPIGVSGSVAISQNQVIYPQQQQQQQQFNTNSSSPLSNSSSNSSSSCLTTASYSPLQHNHQSIIYTSSGANSANMPGLTHNPIILTLPIVNNGQVQSQQLVAQITNTNNNTTTPNNCTINNNYSGSNPSPNTSNSVTLCLDSSSSNTSSIYSYNSSANTKPNEAKKVKTQKTQPSKVVHIRNIPQQITEIEIIQFGLIFGNIANVLNLRSKCQAFLEFEKCEEAQSMINYFVNNPISVAGRQIFVQYSNYKNLVTDPTNTNNQVAKAALDLAKDLHKAAQSGGQNTVLRAMIQNMLYGVSLDTIYQIFSRYGAVLKIITFTKNDKFQALIQMKDANAAQSAKNSLHGQNIYNSCCTLHIDYSKLNTLNVKYNNEKSRDYTNPLLPAGDCPDHLTLGPGGVINSPLQLSMVAAAAGYANPFATTQIPAGYHLAPAGNPFLHYNGKYLPQQTLINASTLLQPSNIQAANLNSASVTGQSNATATALANHSAALAAAYGINQHATTIPGQTISNMQGTTNQQTNNVNTIIAANPGHPQQGHMLFPFLQNLNDEGYIMMYTTT